MTRKKERNLQESDFRLIRKTIKAKTGKTYTTEYVRKVYNGVRKNNRIIHEIDQYRELREEFEYKLMAGT